MKLNWNFQWGVGVQTKKPSVGGVWLFSGTTHFGVNASVLKLYVILSCLLYWSTDLFIVGPQRTIYDKSYYMGQLRWVYIVYHHVLPIRYPTKHIFIYNSLLDYRRKNLHSCDEFLWERAWPKHFLAINLLLLIFRAKIAELATEISRLQKEIDTFNQENATFLTYEKRCVHHK